MISGVIFKHADGSELRAFELETPTGSSWLVGKVNDLGNAYDTWEAEEGHYTMPQFDTLQAAIWYLDKRGFAKA